MMMKTFLAASALSMAVVGAASAATIVQNGSFEIGTEGLTTPNWAIYPGGLPGWDTTQGGIEIQTAGTVGLTPYEGNHYAELDGNSNYTMSQTVDLRVGSHEMAFAYSPRINNIATNTVAYGLGSNSLGGLFAEFVTGPGGVSGTAIGAWNLITTKFFVETAGKYVLSFAGGGSSDSLGGFVDAVSISAVPVPAGGLLLLGALGGLAALRRRKLV
ncbi:MAG: VPLPA-CTERM sorting domain-containing protein [Cypionkella sp.]